MRDLWADYLKRPTELFIHLPAPSCAGGNRPS
jgi:hypothetical protein